jgi:hypothetical protein
VVRCRYLLFSVPTGGTVVAPGGQGTCGAIVLAAGEALLPLGVVVLAVVPGAVEVPGVDVAVAPCAPGAPVAFDVDGVCVVLVVPMPLVVVPVPVPVPEFLGCVDVPVPAPDGTHGGAAVGAVVPEGVVAGVLCVVPGVGAIVPDGVGAVVPDGVGVIVPDGVGAVVPDGVGVVVWLCAAMPITDIADASANAVESVVSLRCIAFLLRSPAMDSTNAVTSARLAEPTAGLRV